MVANTGTYLDSPHHRFADGVDLAGLALDQLVDLPAVVIPCGAGTGDLAIDVPLLTGHDVAGKAVLLFTGDSARFGTPEYVVDASYLTRAGAAWLVACGCRPGRDRRRQHRRAWPTRSGRRTRSCSAPGSRSWSTSRRWPRCRWPARASRRYRLGWWGSGRSQSARSQLCRPDRHCQKLVRIPVPLGTQLQRAHTLNCKGVPNGEGGGVPGSGEARQMAGPIYETERCLVRDWQPGEEDRMFDLYRRMEVAKWLGAEPKPMQSRDQAERGITGVGRAERRARRRGGLGGGAQVRRRRRRHGAAGPAA